ncbi:hypothetical protein GOV09_05330 [Candidatus Woesearchaeota archaeon]|nr:hypothetical protein [Candidatus Woesearchaeota archaeon]
MAKYKNIQTQGKPVPGDLKIRFKGTWDMQDLYESVAHWLRDRKWKFHEKEIEQEPPTPYGQEKKYTWYAERDMDEWVRLKLNIFIHTYDLQDIVVVGNDGGQKTVQKGKMWIYMKINDTWDYEENWDKKRFFGQLKDFYIKYIVKKRRMQGWSPRTRTELVQLYHFIQNKLKTESRQFEHKHIAGVHRRGP